MEEGQLKERLASPQTELFWKRYAYSHRKEDGSFPSQNEYIIEILGEAKQEFPEAVNGMKWTDFEKQLKEWFVKWFGR